MSTPSSQYGYASWFCIMRQTPPARHRLDERRSAKDIRG